MKEKYLEEYERYKNIEIVVGKYKLISEVIINFSITEINGDLATLRNDDTGFVRTRTLHWCRKHLTKQ